MRHFPAVGFFLAVLAFTLVACAALWLWVVQ